MPNYKKSADRSFHSSEREAKIDPLTMASVWRRCEPSNLWFEVWKDGAKLSHGNDRAIAERHAKNSGGTVKIVQRPVW